LVTIFANSMKPKAKGAAISAGMETKAPARMK
jgi:hypothetical protein